MSLEERTNILFSSWRQSGVAFSRHERVDFSTVTNNYMLKPWNDEDALERTWNKQNANMGTLNITNAIPFLKQCINMVEKEMDNDDIPILHTGSKIHRLQTP